MTELSNESQVRGTSAAQVGNPTKGRNSLHRVEFPASPGKCMYVLLKLFKFPRAHLHFVITLGDLRLNLGYQENQRTIMQLKNVDSNLYFGDSGKLLFTPYFRRN
jgi:hypothetical protein